MPPALVLCYSQDDRRCATTEADVVGTTQEEGRTKDASQLVCFATHATAYAANAGDYAERVRT